MSAPVVELKDVHLNLNGRWILQGIHLSIIEGEIFVLIGPSGHGKSLLMKVMSGLIPPTQGKVLIRGEDLYSMSPSARRRLICRMGMLFQKNALFDSLTCWENIAFPLQEVTSFSSTEIDKVVHSFLEAVGLSHVKNLFPDEISGGMQKRLGIARALALRPEIVFYDDPTAGLDPITSRKIVQLIIDLRNKNRSTATVVTNDMNRAYQMAHRLGMLVDRELVLIGTPDEARIHSDLRVHQFINGKIHGPLTQNEVHPNKNLKEAVND